MTNKEDSSESRLKKSFGISNRNGFTLETIDLEFTQSPEDEDLLQHFKKELAQNPEYEITEQKDSTGQIIGFNITKTIEGQKQQVFSSTDNPSSSEDQAKTKTCSFSQPFDHNILSAYLQKVPDQILRIKECADFDTFKAFVNEVNKNRTNNPIKFEIPANVLKTLNDSASNITNNVDRSAAFELIDRYQASKDEIQGVLSAKRNQANH